MAAVATARARVFSGPPASASSSIYCPFSHCYCSPHPHSTVLSLMSAKYYTKGKAAPAAARSPASILELDQTRAADCRGSRARVVNWSDSTQKMPCIRPKSAKKCHCNLKCPKSAIPNSCILLHLKKYISQI